MEQNTNLNKETGQFATIYKIASTIMIAMLMIISAVAFALFFNRDSRYLISSPVVFALYGALAITVIFALSALFMLKGTTLTLPAPTANRIIAAISAGTSAVPFIYYIYSDASAKIAAITSDAGSAAASYEGLDTLATMITVVSAVSTLCSLYLVIRGSKVAALISGYGRVIFLALIITKLYLDFSVELNSPVKILVQFGAAAAMLATTAQLRPLIGKHGAPYFVLTQFLSAALCLLCFVLFATEIAPNFAKYTTDLFVFPIMLLLFGIESAVNLFACRIEVCTAPPEIGNEEVDSSKEIANTEIDTPECETASESTKENSTDSAEKSNQ